jgi:hypothetical protein
MSDGGKGHTQRPRSVADEEWANRWDAIFGKDKQPAEKEVKDGLHMGYRDVQDGVHVLSDKR